MVGAIRFSISSSYVCVASMVGKRCEFRVQRSHSVRSEIAFRYALWCLHPRIIEWQEVYVHLLPCCRRSAFYVDDCVFILKVCIAKHYGWDAHAIYVKRNIREVVISVKRKSRGVDAYVVRRLRAISRFDGE